MSEASRAGELVERADATVDDDPEMALELLAEAAEILDAIDLGDAYDASLVGRSVNSYVSLARETEAQDGRKQAIQAGVDRASQKLKLL